MVVNEQNPDDKDDNPGDKDEVDSGTSDMENPALHKARRMAESGDYDKALKLLEGIKYSIEEMTEMKLMVINRK